MIAVGVLEELAATVEAADPRMSDFDLQARLRAGFGGLRVVVCNDDDVPANMPPALGNARCNLYYLDAGEHCVKLTREAEAASGLVVGIVFGSALADAG